MKWLIAALAFVVLSVFGLVVGQADRASAGPEFKNASIRVHSSADLVAPLGIFVTVTYSCFPGSLPFGTAGALQLAVSQEDGDSNIVVFDAECDDTSHTLTVLVPGFWVPGEAAVFAQVRNGDSTSLAQVYTTIRIR